MQAVETIMGNVAVSPPTYTPAPKEQKPKVLLLPKANRCATHAVEYLHGRGIDYDLIDFCISTGRLYVGGELDEGDEQPEKKAKEYER